MKVRVVMWCILSNGNKYVGQETKIEHNNPAVCVEEKEREKRVKRGPQLIEKGSFEVEF